MSSVFELARELGVELLKTPEIEALLEAKRKFAAEPELVELVDAYALRQQEFEERYAAGETTEEEQRMYTYEMQERGAYLRENPTAAQLFAAEEKFNQYMNTVFSIVTSTIAGDNAPQMGSCGGGCGAGGCGTGGGCGA